jgi:large subunit ribosomal protein L23
MVLNMSKNKVNEILIKPIITEKSLRLVDEQNQYTFEVAQGAGKSVIKEEIEKKFGVKVMKIRILSSHGKRVTWGRLRIKGRRKDVKKAIATLKSSDKIDLFKVK